MFQPQQQQQSNGSSLHSTEISAKLKKEWLAKKPKTPSTELALLRTLLLLPSDAPSTSIDTVLSFLTTAAQFYTLQKSDIEAMLVSSLNDDNNN